MKSTYVNVIAADDDPVDRRGPPVRVGERERLGTGGEIQVDVRGLATGAAPLKVSVTVVHAGHGEPAEPLGLAVGMHRDQGDAVPPVDGIAMLRMVSTPSPARSSQSPMR